MPLHGWLTGEIKISLTLEPGFAAELSLASLVRRLHSVDTAHMSQSAVEGVLEQQGQELMRQLLQACLDLRAPIQVSGPVAGADGVQRTHGHQGEPPLETATRAAAQYRQRALAARLTTCEACHARQTGQVAALYTIEPFGRGHGAGS